MKLLNLEAVNSLKINDYILIILSTQEKIIQVDEKFYRTKYLSHLVKNGLKLYLIESDEERTMLMLGAGSSFLDNNI